MNRVFSSILVALALLSAGCASLRGKQQFAPMNLRMATIYVFDDIKTPGLGTQELVVVNGRPVCTLARREYTWFFVPPGTMDLQFVDPDDPNRIIAARRFVVQAGKPYHIAYKTLKFRREDLERGDGKTYVEFPDRVDALYAKDLVLIRESDGISLTETHRLVRDRAPWSTVRTRDVGYAK